MKLLGLPGLYQNWLMISLDPGCDFYRIKNSINFEYNSKNIQWFRKIQHYQYIDITDSTIINMYVKPENFVWYLYNFLEKTDYVGIQVKNLQEQLFTKASNTLAFDQLLKHFVESYQITKKTDQVYIRNAMIEYFYFVLSRENTFKTIAGLTDKRFINIEYEDFSNFSTLVNKLQHLHNFDLNYFKKMYRILEDTNEEYLNRKTKFKSRVISNDLDILEIAYLGSKIGTNLDWFNEEVRRSLLKEKLLV